MFGVYIFVGQSEDQRDYPQREDHGAEDTSDHHPGQRPGAFRTDAMRNGSREETDRRHQRRHHYRSYPRIHSQLNSIVQRCRLPFDVIEVLFEYRNQQHTILYTNTEQGNETYTSLYTEFCVCNVKG